MLLPEPDDRDDGKLAAEKVYQKGDMAPLCRFMEERYFKVFHNRDYRWANELGVALLHFRYDDCCGCYPVHSSGESLLDYFKMAGVLSI